MVEIPSQNTLGSGSSPTKGFDPSTMIQMSSRTGDGGYDSRLHRARTIGSNKGSMSIIKASRVMPGTAEGHADDSMDVHSQIGGTLHGPLSANVTPMGPVTESKTMGQFLQVDNYFSASPIKNESVDGGESARRVNGTTLQPPGQTRNQNNFNIEALTVNSSAVSPEQPSTHDLIGQFKRTQKLAEEQEEEDESEHDGFSPVKQNIEIATLEHRERELEITYQEESEHNKS